MIELYNADCYEKIKDIPDKSVDLVIIDPPYLFKCGGGGGAFGADKRSYHKEYYAMLRRKGHADEETERLRINANAKRNKDNVWALSSGFDYSILDELCRVQERINAYIWCSKSQLQDLFNYYDDKRCSIDLLTWHKTNPTPTCNNTYLSDTEYCVFVRQRGVKLKGSYHTKRKWYVTKANVEDKKLYGHPTCKPQYIIENFITNSCERGG